MSSSSVTSSREVLNDGLRSHLDQLAQSVSYYYGKLQALELPADLSEELVIDWHRGKVQAWVESQKVTGSHPANGPRRVSSTG